MDWIREYWWVVALVALLVIVLALVLFRPRQRVGLTDSAPLRPHMSQARPAEGRGVAGEAAAATSDLGGYIIGAPIHRALEGDVPRDDLCTLKGVGPKFADALHALGFERFEQLAALSPTEVDRLDDHLGVFSGRLKRDRIVEQADYLARGDSDGFEQKFGKL